MFTRTVLETCPHCYVDLRGSVIPDTDPVEYYSMLVGVYISHIYDGVLFWQCPNCDGRIHRWREGTDMWRKADPYVRPL